MKNKCFLRACLFLALAALLSTAGCAVYERPGEEFPENAVSDAIQNTDTAALPVPSIEAGSVAEALNRRESVRNFSDAAPGIEEAALLLWAAAGMKVEGETGPTRTAPSAGGAYPLEIYLLAGNIEGLDRGVYRYDPGLHGLQMLVAQDERTELAEAALGQSFIADAPLVIVLVAHYERTTGRYGERGERYVLIDAGHVSQNISLQAVELGLGSVIVGAFDDREVAEIISTEGDPLLILPVGIPVP